MKASDRVRYDNEMEGEIVYNETESKVYSPFDSVLTQM